MHKAKALFMPFFTVLVPVLFLLCLWGLGSGAGTPWAGALLTVLPSVALMVQSRFGLGGDKQRYLPVHTLATWAGLALTLYLAATTPGTEKLAVGTALLAATALTLFVFWWSSNGRKVSAILGLGETLPPISAQEESGEPVVSTSLLGNPALLMFYRGNWCPVCTSQVEDIVARYQQLADKGVRIVMISPQPHELTRRVAQTFRLPISFWVDEGNRAAETLGIVHKEGVPIGYRKTYGEDTVLPTTIITDSNGRIIFTDQTRNYRVRPRPEDFLIALKAHGI